MPLPRFDYVSPRTIEEALDLLAEHGPRSKLIAGGTDLMPRMQRGAIRPEIVISLRRIPELRPITFDAQEGLTIGAMASLAEVLDNADVRRHYPSLVDSVHQAANAQIRNMGTVAGNICNGSPCADTAGPRCQCAVGEKGRRARRAPGRVLPRPVRDGHGVRRDDGRRSGAADERPLGVRLSQRTGPHPRRHQRRQRRRRGHRRGRAGRRRAHLPRRRRPDTPPRAPSRGRGARASARCCRIPRGGGAGLRGIPAHHRHTRDGVLPAPRGRRPGPARVG